MIDALRPVAYVHPNPYDTETVLKELRPKYYVKGDDWKGKLPEEQIAICKEHGIEIVYLDTVRNSSSGILRRFLAHHGVENPRSKATSTSRSTRTSRAARNSTPNISLIPGAPRAMPTTSRRAARWRGGTPSSSRRCSQPQRVIDMGCGPGALMFLLQEVGVMADGIDFSQTSKDIAPQEVADRIRIGSITDIDLPDDSYDLVICREVFEHMPVLLVQKAVENLARISSRFVYVTTRFHPNPTSLFDVTTEFDADPTHITCMNKDMLRLMFVLQGFRRRPDLEARMDWLNKNRVLVYEKAGPTGIVFSKSGGEAYGLHPWLSPEPALLRHR